MQSCVHSFFFFYEREGDGKRNILLGWPNKQCLKHVSGFVTVSET